MKRYLIGLFALLAPLAFGQAVPLLQPHQNFVNSAGQPCAGCSLYSYAAGTTTPLATYTDASEGSQNTNPIVLDSAGSAAIWLGSSSYKFVLQDASGVTQWTVDNVQPVAIGSSFGSYLPLSGGTMTGPIHFSTDILPHPPLNVQAFGAKGDGTTDDTAAIQKALDVAACGSAGCTHNGSVALAPVYFPRPSVCYKVTAPLNAGYTPLMQLNGDVKNSWTLQNIGICFTDFASNGAVLDVTADQGGSANSMSIQPLGGSTSSFTHVTGGIFGGVRSTGSGLNMSGFIVYNSSVYAGTATGAAVHIVGDQSTYSHDTFVSDGAACVQGGGHGTDTSLTSTFYTVTFNNGSGTNASIEGQTQCLVTANTSVAALQNTGLGNWRVENAYVQTGPNTTRVIDMSTSTRETIIEFDGLRVEDNNATHPSNVSVLYATTIGGGHISGAFWNAVGSGDVVITATQQIQNLHADIWVTGSSDNTTTFLGQGGLVNSDLLYRQSPDGGTVSIGLGGSSGANIATSSVRAVSDTGDTLAKFLAGPKLNTPGQTLVNNGTLTDLTTAFPNAAYQPTTFTSGGVLQMPMHNTPTSGQPYTFTLPSSGYGVEYYNGGTIEYARCMPGVTAVSGSFITLSPCYTPSSDQLKIPTNLDFSTMLSGSEWTWFDGTTHFTSADSLCYYDGSAYHNCPAGSKIRAGAWSITSATSTAITFTTTMGVTPSSCSVTPSASAATTGTPFATALSATGFMVNIPNSGSISGTYQCVVNNAN